MELLNINKKNKIFILFYVFILSVVVLSYLFMVVQNEGSYNIQAYKNGYIYFWFFNIILFSFIISFWEIKENKKIYIKMLMDSLTLTASSIPLLLMIFIIGNLNMVNIVIPLFFQIIWGMVILSLKEMLKNIAVINKYSDFLLGLFIFKIILLNIIGLYFYKVYANLVLTTVYDKDIPVFFFFSPVISILGSVCTQVGWENQMGYSPILYYILFWSMFIIISAFITLKILKHKEVKHEQY